MRVDESWRSNASESCNSHQLSSTLILVSPGLKIEALNVTDDDNCEGPMVD